MFTTSFSLNLLIVFFLFKAFLLKSLMSIFFLIFDIRVLNAFLLRNVNV